MRKMTMPGAIAIINAIQGATDDVMEFVDTLAEERQRQEKERALEGQNIRDVCARVTAERRAREYARDPINCTPINHAQNLEVLTKGKL